MSTDERISIEVEELHGRMLDAERKIIEHDTRFANGREVMKEIKDELKVVQEAIRPKAPDWLKLGGFAMALVTALLGGHYWINERFNDRPTTAQIEKIMGTHGEIGHQATHRDISGIREVQVEQRTLLNGLSDDVADQGKKLDTIINRLPPRRGSEDHR